jgi:hypothetical protein
MITNPTPTCAVGPCTNPRVEGSSYCRSHGPLRSMSRRNRTARTGDQHIVCPYCQTTGQVHTEQTKVKKGISGGKATGALLTAGLSILVTGLSRKEQITKATCRHCGVSWTI